MKKAKFRLLLFLSVFLVVPGTMWAASLQYEVTITNLTKGQPFSPTVVAIHKPEMNPLFTLGEPSSEGIWRIAESGDASVLMPELSADPDVYDVQLAVEDPASPGPYFPGESVTVILDSGNAPGRRSLSLAGMLGSTNDAFFALNGEPVQHVPSFPAFLGQVWTKVFFATAYDSGTEGNSETCATVPGPPCNNGSNERDTTTAEGYVYVHNGIHGINSGSETDGLDAATSDWRNPVAKVTVRVSRNGF
jgi:hypothetical protein